MTPHVVCNFPLDNTKSLPPKHPMAAAGFLTPFLGALQACVCVLLTMCYGVVARRLRLIHDATINDMSGLAVKLFLPALIVVHLGQQLHLGTALNYVPVLGIAYQLVQTKMLTMSVFDVPDQYGPRYIPPPRLASLTLPRVSLRYRNGSRRHVRSITRLRSRFSYYSR